MKVLHPQNMGYNPQNEGFGFPWYGVKIGDERKDANKSLIRGKKIDDRGVFHQKWWHVTCQSQKNMFLVDRP